MRVSLKYTFKLSESKDGSTVRGTVKHHEKSIFLGYVSGLLAISAGDASIAQLYLNNLQVKVFTESGKFYIDFPKEQKGSKFNAYSPGDKQTRDRITLAILRAVCSTDAARKQVIREHAHALAS